MATDFYSPLDAVNAFKNQQIGALSTDTASGGMGNQRTPLVATTFQQPTSAPVSVGMGEGTKAASDLMGHVAVQPTQNTMDIGKLISTGNQRRAAAAQQNTGEGGGGGPVGSNTYEPQGNLSATRNNIMGEASSYVGNKYVFGGTTHNGIDCSGLVMAVYNKFGFDVNRHDANWQAANIPGVRTSVNNLKPGDIVAWSGGGHIAIYAGNGEIIQAANPNQGVIRSRLVDQVGYTPNSVFGIALRLPGE